MLRTKHIGEHKMTSKKGLTALEIKFLHAKDKPYDVSDVPGLFLRVGTTGQKHGE